MHEMSLCEGILQIIESEAGRQHFTRVKQVILEVGPLSGVEISALEFCFDTIMKNSIADQATLTIIKPEARAWCMHCAESVTIQQRYDACPLCGNYQLQVSSGDEMRIKELEVE
jgi:hydrogenase nickel incorporation protein HypA/HybF